MSKTSMRMRGPKRQPDRKPFGHFLRNARQSCGLTQAALAKSIRVSPVFVSQIETGQRIPSDQVAKNLAIALGLPWQEVLRSVYLLRSKEAGELFAESEMSAEPGWRSVSAIPSIRMLLLQLTGLRLPASHIEALVNKWSSDVQFLKTQLRKVQNG